MKSAFEKAHKARFGFIDRKQGARHRGGLGRGGRRRREVQREEGRDHDARKLPSPARRTTSSSPTASGTTPTVYTRDQLAPGHKVKGPAIIIEPHQTVVVEPGWQAELTAKNHLVLARVVKLKRTHAIGTKADPVMLEVFNNLFMSIAEQMGVVAAEHRLLGQHQGAARLLLRGVRARRHAGRQRAAHAGASRLDGPLGRDHHPRQQGHDQPGRRLRRSTRPTTAARICRTSPSARRCSTTAKKNILFWVASRGHHADVGGISPGSMSPNATTIEEEGVYIDNFKLVDRGRFREKELYDALLGAKYPARNPLQNVNDLKAQIAANEKGVAANCARWSRSSRCRS